MTNPLYTVEQLPTTSAAAIREFSETFIAVMGASQASGWADRLGETAPTAAPMLTFPVSQLRSKYQRTQGENRFKTLGEKSFSVRSEEFDDGYQAKLQDLYQQVFAYRNWQQAPARLLLAEEQLRHASIAALLEAGETTAYLDTAEYFFDAAHAANLFADRGTWSNYQVSTKDVVSVANIEAEIALMQLVKDENGNKLGVMPDTVLVPVEKYEPLKNLLKQQMIANTAGTASITNPYMNGLNIEPIREFTDANDWYLVDSKLLAQGFKPWVIMRQTMPPALQLRWYDESSDFFKDTGSIKVSSHIWYGFSLGLPHAIRKIKGA